MMTTMETRQDTQQTEIVDRDQLVVKNLPFVRHILSKLLNQLPRGIDAENLESAGVLGLIEAASQFDAGRKVEFRTFAYQRIRGAILDELRRNCPLSQQMLQRLSTLRQIRSELDENAPVEEVAAAAGMTVEEVTQCLRGERLTRPERWNDSFRVRGHVGDNDDITAMERREMQEVLADGIETLPERMRVAVALHYNEGLKLKEVGQVLGLSESRVSRVLDSARAKLQDYARSRGY